MAPKRKLAEKPKATPPSLSPRKTRSRTAAAVRPAKATAAPPAANPKKSPKKSPANKPKLSKKSPATPAKVPITGDGSTEVAENQAQADASKASSETVIVIEACKQCQSFKRTAEKVKNGLEVGLAGITVDINPDKPRKGCFEVREKNGETFVSLLDMPRPFKKMKDLDLDKVVSDIIDRIK